MSTCSVRSSCGDLNPIDEIEKIKDEVSAE
jgi:hypothetical protein